MVWEVEEGMKYDQELRIFATEKGEVIYPQAWYLRGAEEVVVAICEAGVEVGFLHPNCLGPVRVHPRHHLVSLVRNHLRQSSLHVPLSPKIRGGGIGLVEDCADMSVSSGFRSPSVCAIGGRIGGEGGENLLGLTFDSSSGLV